MPIVVAFAIVGLLVGGFPGLVWGVLIGLGVRWLLPHLLLGGLVKSAQLSQAQFLDSTFAIMGALSKADGVVTRAEIEMAQRTFVMLRLTGEQRESAKASFNRGKAPEFDLDTEIDKLRSAVGIGRGPLLRLFLQLECMAVAADGVVHESEHAMLVQIARRLGLTEFDVAQLEALLRAAGAGAAGSAGSSRPGSARPRARLEDAHTALGLNADASDAEVKRAYRRLIGENHPDRLAAKGVPESMRQVAEERTREINVAYDLIKESRGFK